MKARSTAGVRRGAGKKKGRGKTRSATAESNAWKAAVLQVAREGRAADIAARSADLEARGDIVRQGDGDDELEAEELENAEAVNAEINLEDEDLTPLEDLDRTNNEFTGMSLRPGQTFIQEDESPLQSLDIEIRIVRCKCRVLRPTWMQAEALTPTGEEFLDEIGTRFGVIEAVAEWLERKRKDFLEKPEPMALGVRALEEMKEGLPSVSQGAFLRLSKIEERITRLADVESKKKKDIESLFCRYTKGCHLVWRDANLPLEFIFSREARMAWVASAVLQKCAASREPLTRDRLNKVRHVTTPKTTEEMNSLSRMNVSALGLEKFIAQANLMADTAWTEVVSAYLKHLI